MKFCLIISIFSLTLRMLGPKGISFDFEPASMYTCNYAVGEFLPKQVPKCVYGNLKRINKYTHTIALNYLYLIHVYLKEKECK